MAKSLIPKRNLNEALNGIIRQIYGGDDDGIKAQLRSILKPAFAKPEKAEEARKQLQSFGVSDPTNIINQIAEIRDNEFAFYTDPQAFARKKIEDVLARSADMTLPELQDAYDQLKEISDTNYQVRNVPNAAVLNQGNEFDYGQMATANYGEDVKDPLKVVGDLLRTAQDNATKDTAVEDFITGLPQDLKASRNEFLQGETERATQAFQRYVPRALEDLNARGLLDSGQVEDVLSSKAVDLAGGLQDLQAEAEAQDNQFYFDAAYRNAIRKSLESTTDYRSAIESERNRISAERGERFSSSQADLDRKLSEKLTTSAYDRQLASDKKRLESERRAADDAKESQLISSLVGAGTSIAGSYLGGKAAASGSKSPALNKGSI